MSHVVLLINPSQIMEMKTYYASSLGQIATWKCLLVHDPQIR